LGISLLSGNGGVFGFGAARFRGAHLVVFFACGFAQELSHGCVRAMTAANSLELALCIVFGLLVFGHEVVEVLRARRRTTVTGIRDGDLARYQRYILARSLVATTAAVMVVLLSIIALR
jgi:hypothetical protein